MTNRNVLYRIYDSDGALLYIGATTHPARRFQTHAQHQPWWDDASEIKLQRYASTDELVEAEAEAIATERPKYNWIHNGVVGPWSHKPRRRRGDGTLFFRSSDRLWVGRIEMPPGHDGRRRVKVVASKDRKTAELKLATLKAEHGIE